MDTRFTKGMIPWNKGTKGIMKSNSGSFRKGITPHNKKEHIIKTCFCCNKIFEVKQSLNRVNYCSNSCCKKGNKYRKGSRLSYESRLKMRISKLGIRGECHWNWRGGYNRTIRSIEMGRDEYIQWRKKVFIRDNYTCQICGVIVGYLEADHIKSWAGYPDLRYDLSNGRTLCRKCHVNTPTWGGRNVSARRIDLRATI